VGEGRTFISEQATLVNMSRTTFFRTDNFPLGLNASLITFTETKIDLHVTENELYSSSFGNNDRQTWPKLNSSHKKCKVTPLQARCGPEGG
jgi:hypothetical protein